jgi:hypothetical protein
MLITTAEQHIDFLRNHVLETVESTFRNNQLLFGFMTAAQATEIMGSYLDDKPLRAKQQSLKRFSLAINRLFPQAYYDANNDNFLYFQLRACMTHMFLPTARLSLNSGKGTKEKPHLFELDGVLYLYSEEYLRDFRYAISNLERRIKEGRIKLKTLSAGELNDSVN